MREIKNVLILFNKSFYREVDIDNFEDDEITIGLSDDKDIKLNFELNTEISLKVAKVNNYWELIETKGVYCVINGIKATKKRLIHGDQISVKLNSNKIELFKINFFIDFASGKENYDKMVYLSGKAGISVGSGIDSDISIDDELVDKSHCYIKKERENEYSIVDMNSRYGVHINGKKISGKVILKKSDFIIICGYKFLFMETKILFSNYNDKIKINNLISDISPVVKSALQYPEFIRNPRYKYNLPKDKIEIIAPPTKAQKPSLEAFLPLVSTIAMAIMFTFMMPDRAGLRIAMVGITVAMTVITFIIKSKKANKEIEKRNSMYLNYMKEQEELIKHLYNEQIRISNIVYPEMNESIETLEEFKRRLWEKRVEDDDFLSVSLGRGTVNLSFEVQAPNEKWGETEDELILLPKELKEKYKEIQNMPITLNLVEENGVAIIGDKAITSEYIYDLLIQIITYHHYEDTKIVFIYDEEEEDKWNWLRWLPHVWSKDKKVRFIGKGKESAHLVLGYINEILSSREAFDDKKLKADKPYFLFFVTNPLLLDDEEIALFFEKNKVGGYTPIFLYENIQLVPNNCTSIINIQERGLGEVFHVENAEKIRYFSYKNSVMKNYEEFSRRMAPIYVKESFSANSLPKCITLFELYNVNSSREIPIKKLWSENQVFKGIAAPLGVNNGGELVALNLHEKVHGPHGLVAGTTGSGKSEILQSLIISLALQYHPHDINFILIDYKGGGMANLFKDLPHLVGTITNLDGNQIERSLIAIKSELKRRQRIFGEHDVNHIDDYIKLYKEKKVSFAIPHLIMIADEFAELKSDQPEFMKELVSTARIGRSLGVHLILATQKPSGVVDSQIWSNSKFKLCLKVQDVSDSREVLKTDLAAHIVEPGRSYFQVGNNEIFELFQSAWSGAKKFEDDDIRKNDIEISSVSLEGIREVIYSTKDADKNKKSITQLDESIRTIGFVAKQNGIESLPGPWLPILKEEIYLEEILNKFTKKENIIELVLGVYDDPEAQRQDILSVNLSENGNMIISGAAAYGKTNMLQTIITSAIQLYTPREINIYILDFGTRVLKVFEKANHVGGVILEDDEEKIKNFFMLISNEIEKRKNLFADMGVSSLKSYKDATNKEMPHIVILIDNYVAFKEAYPEREEMLNLFARDGNTLGISIILTTSTYTGLRSKVTNNYKNNLTFTAVDKSEYFTVFGIRKFPTNIKGRGLMKLERVVETQICLPVKGENDLERTKKIMGLIENTKMKYKMKAMRIPMMPDILELNEVLQHIRENDIEKEIILGINYETLGFESYCFKENPVFTILGRDKCGKTNFIYSLINTIREFSENNIFYAIDSDNLGLIDIEDDSDVEYASEDNIEEVLEKISIELAERNKLILEANINKKGNKNYIEEALKEKDNIYILIDDLETLINNTSKESRHILVELCSKYRQHKVYLILAGRVDKFKELMIRDELVKKVKEEQCGLLFDSIGSQTFYTAKLRYGTKERNIECGDAYFIRKGNFNLLKTIKII